MKPLINTSSNDIPHQPTLVTRHRQSVHPLKVTPSHPLLPHPRRPKQSEQPLPHNKPCLPTAVPPVPPEETSLISSPAARQRRSSRVSRRHIYDRTKVTSGFTDAPYHLVDTPYQMMPRLIDTPYQHTSLTLPINTP